MLAPLPRLIRVVVADDDSLFAEALAQLLEADGRFEVIGIAANGEQAVQLACWHDPDLVVMDVRMPVMDGVEATRALSASRPRVCVLLVSGEERPAEAAEAGAILVRKERITPEAIHRIIRARVGNSEGVEGLVRRGGR